MATSSSATLLTAVLVVVGLWQLVAAAIVCPQKPLNDLTTKFCASNSYGSLDVTRGEFENWNCNHPGNRYTQLSQLVCAPGPTAIECMPNACMHEGPLICARLRSPSAQFPNAFTTAVFGNRCQLTLYNCRNPTKQYFAVTPQPTNMSQCVSFR